MTSFLNRRYYGGIRGPFKHSDFFLFFLSKTSRIELIGGIPRAWWLESAWGYLDKKKRCYELLRHRHKHKQKCIRMDLDTHNYMLDNEETWLFYFLIGCFYRLSCVSIVIKNISSRCLKNIYFFFFLRMAKVRLSSHAYREGMLSFSYFSWSDIILRYHNIYSLSPDLAGHLCILIGAFMCVVSLKGW